MDRKPYFPLRRLLANLALALIFCAGATAQESSPTQAPAKRAKPTGEPAATARGQVIFRDRCAICHFAESTAQKIGPGLKAIYERGKFASGGKVDDESMEKRILSGGKDMPPLRALLNSGQVRDLIAYLRTL